MPASNTAAYTSPTAHTRFNRVLFGYQVAVVDVAMEVSALAKIAAATAETTMSPFEVPAGPRHFGDRVVVAVSLPHQGCRRLLKHPPPPYGKRRLQESGVAGALAADIGRMDYLLKEHRRTLSARAAHARYLLTKDALLAMYAADLHAQRMPFIFIARPLLAQLEATGHAVRQWPAVLPVMEHRLAEARDALVAIRNWIGLFNPSL